MSAGKSLLTSFKILELMPLFVNCRSLNNVCLFVCVLPVCPCWYSCEFVLCLKETPSCYCSKATGRQDQFNTLRFVCLVMYLSYFFSKSDNIKCNLRNSLGDQEDLRCFHDTIYC